MPAVHGPQVYPHRCCRNFTDPQRSPFSRLDENAWWMLIVEKMLFSSWFIPHLPQLHLPYSMHDKDAKHSILFTHLCICSAEHVLPHALSYGKSSLWVQAEDSYCLGNLLNLHPAFLC